MATCSTPLLHGQREDALDDGDHPVAELGAALGERRHVPLALAPEPLLHPEPEHRRQHVFERDTVGHVAIGLHLAQFRIHHGLELLALGDLPGGLPGPLQMTARHRVDLLGCERGPDRGGLPLTSL